MVGKGADIKRRWEPRDAYLLTDSLTFKRSERGCRQEKNGIEKIGLLTLKMAVVKSGKDKYLITVTSSPSNENLSVMSPEFLPFFT